MPSKGGVGVEDRESNMQFVGFTFKKNVESRKMQAIQNLLSEIENTRDKKKLNRHNSDNKEFDNVKEKANNSEITQPKRQKTQDRGDRGVGEGFDRKRLILGKAPKPGLVGLKSDDKKKNNLASSTNKLKKTLETLANSNKRLEPKEPGIGLGGLGGLGGVKPKPSGTKVGHMVGGTAKGGPPLSNVKQILNQIKQGGAISKAKIGTKPTTGIGASKTGTAEGAKKTNK